MCIQTRPHVYPSTHIRNDKLKCETTSQLPECLASKHKTTETHAHCQQNGRWRIVGPRSKTVQQFLFFFFFFFFFFFPDRVSLYSPGCPGTHSVDQADLELRNLPASASQVLGSKACATTAWHFFFFKVSFIYVFYVYGCSVCMCVCMPEEGIKFNL
jgi:hypothetical protein